MNKLVVPQKKLLTREAAGQVGIRGTWQGRVYRRNGELVELRGENLFLNSGLDLIGSRFDTLGMAAETDPAYRFENWLPHLALGADGTPPQPSDPAAVLSWVGTATIDQEPLVTELAVAGPPAERGIDIVLHYAYTAAGGEQVAEVGICHWDEGRHLTRSLVYDLAGAPVTVSLGAGDTFLLDYFIQVRTPAFVEFQGVPMPEGDEHTWQLSIGNYFLRHLFRYALDSSETLVRAYNFNYPYISAWNEPEYTGNASRSYRPIVGAQASWDGEWNWLQNPSLPYQIGPTVDGPHQLFMVTQRAWERLPYMPGSHQLSFAVSTLRNVDRTTLYPNQGLFWSDGGIQDAVHYLAALAYGPFARTDTYLRTVFTVAWGNA